MAKLILTDLANLENQNSAVANINANNTAIEVAMEKTLSRDGTSPNQMEANFDMNSNRILNLPKAVNADEPLRLQDLSDFYGTGGVSNIPAGGNSGDVLAKTSNTNYLFDWVSDSSLITAGTNLTKSGTSPVTIGTLPDVVFTTVNKITITQPAVSATITIANTKTLTVSNTLTFTGTDSSTADFGAGGTVAYKGSPLSQFASTTSSQLAGVISDETGTGLLVFGTNPILTTPNLGTPSAAVLTNATGLPVSTGISGMAAGAATFLTTPSSANLRALLTDEVGTGAAYFVGGALGTPASGVATNLTGLPISTGLTGAGTGVLTALGVNVGTAGSVVINGGALGTPSSGTLTNATGLPLSGLTAQAAYTIVANNSGSSAIPTAMDITALTSKASPVSADIVLIQDSAASNAFKKTTVGALSSAGSVASYNTRTGAVAALENDVPLRNYLTGLSVSAAGSTATFGITVGVATDSTNVSMMKLASAYTKTASAWAVGSGNGALDTGTIAASTWYSVYLIQRPDTGVVDVLISLSATSPTLPTNYTLFRHIWFMKTDGSSQWIKFFQDNDECSWSSPVVDITANNPGTSAVTRTLASIPTGIRVKARVQFSMVNTSVNASYGYLSDLSVADDNPATPRPAQTGQTGNIAGNVAVWIAELYVYTNTSAQVRSRISYSDANVTIYLTTMGFTYTRGK